MPDNNASLLGNPSQLQKVSMYMEVCVRVHAYGLVSHALCVFLKVMNF